MNTYQPISSISSRYSLSTVPSNLYQSINILSGNTLQEYNTASSTGVIFCPYIPITLTMDMEDKDWREWQKQKLKTERKEKLNKLKW